MDYGSPANKESVEKTQKSLQEKGYFVFVAGSGTEALEKIKTLIPQGASVMNGSSVTLNEIGYMDYVKSGKSGWTDLHAKVDAENDPVKRAQIRKLSEISDFYLGSVNALTEDGQMIIGSNTGTQLPHIDYTSQNLILVVGTQKIVPDLGEAMKRLETYVFPLEDNRLKATHGRGSALNKILIFRGENPHMGRKINIILVNGKTGF